MFIIKRGIVVTVIMALLFLAGIIVSLVLTIYWLKLGSAPFLLLTLMNISVIMSISIVIGFFWMQSGINKEDGLSAK